ncbi:type II toxin-antitoxin system Phd/YefM family antitoxin [Mesoaciditoga lauensis]|uniref:type II toxin-antitoxin system Phd/YefM family antitoxin n=1 Tax=Mesoaciditoga lauensis TaxID=1495039 RepID=UPI00055F1327|nr:type II toxin-antitoxin system Phd/YefM family antitoxin [Mesoaciditoga lauensis]
MLGELRFYSVAEAKTELSKLISTLKKGDVVITKNGIPAAAVMDYERYVKMIDFLEKIKDIYLLDIGTSTIEDPINTIIKDD